MSSGAGKVYFILYLAVVLELLIIIVERDEAEEHLHQKQKETMKIVESILAQLYSGSGTEGINTRPQDVITIFDAGVESTLQEQGVNIKKDRRYIVEVGVTDIVHEWKRKEGETDKELHLRKEKLVDLANVAQLQYQVFYNPSSNEKQPPTFLSEEKIKHDNIDFSKYEEGAVIPSPNPEEDPWQFLGFRELQIDRTATYDNLVDNEQIEATDVHPVYKPVIDGPGPDPFFAPQGLEDSIFYYDKDVTMEIVEKKGGISGIKKRAFIVNFSPPDNPGWYKLRFISHTNRILGVRKDKDGTNRELKDEETVNIGTVQLTVKDLKKVQHTLKSQLDYDLPPQKWLENGSTGFERFSAGIEECIALASQRDKPRDAAQIKLYGYISKLLTPGASINFDQNRNSIEFNVFVVKPPIKTGPISLEAPKEVHVFDACFNDKLQNTGIIYQFFATNFADADSKIIGTLTPEEGGNPITFIPINKGPVESTTGATDDALGGEKVMFWVKLDRKFEGKEGRPNVLNAKLTYTKGGQTKEALTTINIYQTGIDKPASIKSLFSIRAKYGELLTLETYPLSGGKIPANDFFYNFRLNTENQATTIHNTKIQREDNIMFPCNATTAYLSLEWKHPVTGEEVKIFPLDENELAVEIKQDEPYVSGGYQPTINDFDPFNPVITIKGVGVQKMTFCGDSSKIAKPEVEVNVNSIDFDNYFVVSGKPQITQTGETDNVYQYDITIYLTGEIPDDLLQVTGSIDVLILATVNNKYAAANGKATKKAIRKFTNLTIKAPFDEE